MDPLRYLAPPRPFGDISDALDADDVEQRRDFASSIKNNAHLNMPDSDREAISAYWHACDSLIDGGDLPAEINMKTIREFEQSLQTNGPVNLRFDLATRTKMGEELDNLHDMWSFVRYEKYLPATVKEDAEKHPSAKVPDPWHKAFWKPFYGRLEAEADAWAKVLSGKNHFNECPTYLLLGQMCEDQTVDWDETVALIKHCAVEGVELPKADFVDYLKAKDVVGLARRLGRDEDSIGLSTEYVMGVGAMLLAYFKLHLPEALYENEEDPDPERWVPKKRLHDLMALEDGHEQAVQEVIRELFYEMVLGGSDDDEDAWEDEDESMDEDDDGGDVDLLAMMSSLGGGRYGPNGYNHNVYMGNGQFAEYQWGLSDSD
ncbi:hypothetical protein CNMCM5793_007772 [Aspergillus hiratsukae]|uniref:Uncharacterized protein n=1 Tax=Aspergillus hiratsukae TaxID=1194566 RepID=A0A8H6P0G0_9EURO|nr:hypothetical protein CNMCM5793_007772 [Aspergillus hiratsukae]KAF7157781.1 hypothetical protein CNMCM6106_003910 [Aspergillus hiratsukae]